jgi:hypothetical protein
MLIASCFRCFCSELHRIIFTGAASNARDQYQVVALFFLPSSLTPPRATSSFLLTVAVLPQGIVAKQSRTIASGWQMSGAVAGPLFAKSFLLNSTHHPFNPTRPSNAPSSICATTSPPLIAIVETFSDASALSFSTLLLRQIFLILRFQDGGRAGSRADPTCC